jgi:uncharacterized protein
MSAPRVPVDASILEGVESTPTLVGGRCRSCEIVMFPRQDSCPRCAETDVVHHRLARRGRLWAWTTQDFPPPAPPYLGATGRDFVPFAVGYVDVGGEVKVESRLTVRDPEQLTPGMDMELVVTPFRIDDDGREVVTFAFAPIAGEA